MVYPIPLISQQHTSELNMFWDVNKSRKSEAYKIL
jgi:hypothetical protein